MVTDFIFLGFQITVDDDCSYEVKKRLLEENNDKPRQHIKKQRYYFAYKGPYSQSYGFSSIYVHMGEVDSKNGWSPKN